MGFGRLSRSAAGANMTEHTAPLSCLIFTLNEAVNLPHCLHSLQWCDDVVVVDSFSSDETKTIACASGTMVSAISVN